MIELSVIIPTFGRATALHRCLMKLSESDFPKEEFEVIVVDDGSPEPIELSVDQFQTGFNFFVLRQENAGAGAARNLGVRHSSGRYLAFIDDDCLAGAGWLKAIQARLSVNPCLVVGGLTTNAPSGNVYARVSHRLAHKDYVKYETDPSSVYFFGSNNFALSRETFDRAGGFDERLRPAYEDRELCDRLVEEGFHLAYAPEAVVAHNRVMTLTSFFRQHMGYGRGAFFYYGGTARRSRSVTFASLFRLMGEVAGESYGAGRVYAIALVILSQLAASCGMIFAALRREKQGRGGRCSSGVPILY